jgi:hypothetical protein
LQGWLRGPPRTTVVPSDTRIRFYNQSSIIHQRQALPLPFCTGTHRWCLMASRLSGSASSSSATAAQHHSTNQSRPSNAIASATVAAVPLLSFWSSHIQRSCTGPACVSPPNVCNTTKLQGKCNQSAESRARAAAQALSSEKPTRPLCTGSLFL